MLFSLQTFWKDLDQDSQHVSGGQGPSVLLTVSSPRSLSPPYLPGWHAVHGLVCGGLRAGFQPSWCHSVGMYPGVKDERGRMGAWINSVSNSQTFHKCTAKLRRQTCYGSTAPKVAPGTSPSSYDKGFWNTYNQGNKLCRETRQRPTLGKKEKRNSEDQQTWLMIELPCSEITE